MNFSEAFVTQVHIQGYRSLENVTVNLEPLTAFVGPNGSGKSSFVELFEFIKQCLLLSPKAALDERGGIEQLVTLTGNRPRTITIDIEVKSRAPELFAGSYYLEIRLLTDGDFSIPREMGEVRGGGEKSASHRYVVEYGKWIESSLDVQPALASNRLALPLLSGIRQFAPIYQTLTQSVCYELALSTLRNPQDSQSLDRLSPDGSNAARLLKQIQDQDTDSYQTIEDVIKRVIPGIAAMRPKRTGRHWTVEFVEKFDIGPEVKFEAMSMSEGTIRLLALLLAIYSPLPPSIIILEEPEATLHPGAAAVLVDALKEAALRTQILVTTHSPDLITRFDANSLRAVERINGVSHIGDVAHTQLEAIRQRLFTAGEIHRLEGLRPEPDKEEMGV